MRSRNFFKDTHLTSRPSGCPHVFRAPLWLPSLLHGTASQLTFSRCWRVGYFPSSVLLSETLTASRAGPLQRLRLRPAFAQPCLRTHASSSYLELGGVYQIGRNCSLKPCKLREHKQCYLGIDLDSCYHSLSHYIILPP